MLLYYHEPEKPILDGGCITYNMVKFRDMALSSYVTDGRGKPRKTQIDTSAVTISSSLGNKNISGNGRHKLGEWPRREKPRSRDHGSRYMDMLHLHHIMNRQRQDRTNSIAALLWLNSIQFLGPGN
jgi:hypothetical protein